MPNYYNPYYNSYNPYVNTQFALQEYQNMRNDLDKQINHLQQQQQQNQFQQPPQNSTQNFYLTPNPTNADLEAKYADNVEEVKNTFVMKTGIFTTKDFSKLWIKDVTGNIRIFDTQEIIEVDEKDKVLQEKDNEILSLKAEINQLKEVMTNANTTPVYNAKFNESVADEKSTGIPNGSKHSKK